MDTDERKARRLRDGLRPEIRTALASHGKLTYKDMLHRAMEVESALPEVEESPVVTAGQQGQGQKRKWEDNSRRSNWNQDFSKRQQYNSQPSRNAA